MQQPRTLIEMGTYIRTVMRARVIFGITPNPHHFDQNEPLANAHGAVTDGCDGLIFLLERPGRSPGACRRASPSRSVMWGNSVQSARRGELVSSLMPHPTVNDEGQCVLVLERCRGHRSRDDRRGSGKYV